jgi:dimethylargininase
MAAIATGMTAITHGLVRKVSRSLGDCELAYLPRAKFDLDLAIQQHYRYTEILRQAGVEVAVLPEEPDLPDATFVEDTVVILDELAILCRPGVKSREAEIEKIQTAVGAIRAIHRITAPGTLEGGDVLRVGRTFYVGCSRRTNAEGIQQLDELVSPFGYRVESAHIRRCLHLKSAVTSPAEGMLLVNPEWIDCAPLRGFELLRVLAGEPWGANTLNVNDSVLVPASVPRTADLLESRGLRVCRLDISELQKAEAGLTCLSVLFSHQPFGVPPR